MVLTLVACRTGPSQYVTDMQVYQGTSEASLIDALGPPDNQYTVEGVKYLTYSKVSQQIYPTNSGGFGVGTGLYRNGGGVFASQDFATRNASIQTYRCDVFFAIRNKRVDKIGHRGEAC